MKIFNKCKLLDGLIVSLWMCVVFFHILINFNVASLENEHFNCETIVLNAEKYVDKLIKHSNDHDSLVDVGSKSIHVINITRNNIVRCSGLKKDSEKPFMIPQILEGLDVLQKYLQGDDEELQSSHPEFKVIPEILPEDYKRNERLTLLGFYLDRLKRTLYVYRYRNGKNW